MNDVYHEPNKFGLTKVAEIDYSDQDYQFDLRVVWRHKDGRYFTARDSGCSCPSPFEDYDSLDKLTPFKREDVEREAREQSFSSRYDGEDIVPFLSKLRDLK